MGKLKDLRKYRRELEQQRDEEIAIKKEEEKIKELTQPKFMKIFKKFIK